MQLVAMATPDPLVAAYKRDVDRTLIRENLSRSVDDRLRTLAEWQERFQRAWPEIRRLGFDKRFRRMWAFYLAYCEAGFRTNAIDVAHYRIEQS